MDKDADVPDLVTIYMGFCAAPVCAVTNRGERTSYRTDPSLSAARKKRVSTTAFFSLPVSSALAFTASYIRDSRFSRLHVTLKTLVKCSFKHDFSH